MDRIKKGGQQINERDKQDHHIATSRAKKCPI